LRGDHRNDLGVSAREFGVFGRISVNEVLHDLRVAHDQDLALRLNLLGDFFDDSLVKIVHSFGKELRRFVLQESSLAFQLLGTELLNQNLNSRSTVKGRPLFSFIFRGSNLDKLSSTVRVKRSEAFKVPVRATFNV